MAPKDKTYLIKKDPALNSGIFYLGRIVFLIFTFFYFAPSYSQNTEVKIENPKQNFETVDQGEVVKFKYVITNIGTVPLLFKDYEVECSCTSADYQTEPILPGKSGTINVQFDTKSAYERQDRVVKIFCNVKDGYIKVRFKGNVKRKK